MSKTLEQIVAEAIRADLIRQSQSDRYDAAWVSESATLSDANIDGYVNLLELARAAINALPSSAEKSEK